MCLYITYYCSKLFRQFSLFEIITNNDRGAESVGFITAVDLVSRYAYNMSQPSRRPSVRVVMGVPLNNIYIFFVLTLTTEVLYCLLE